MFQRSIAGLLLVPVLALAAQETRTFGAGHEFEGLPRSAQPTANYARDPQHPLNELHALLFLGERTPTEIGASLPAERAKEGLGDAEFFTGKWYFRNRREKEISAADRRLFGGDVRVSPVEDLTGKRGERLRKLLATLATREQVADVAELRAPLARAMLQWDLLSVWWRIERNALDGEPLAAEETTLVAMARTIHALALDKAEIAALESGVAALAPAGDGNERAKPYVPAGLLAEPQGAWLEIARDVKELFHARNSLRTARVFVRAESVEATRKLVELSAKATDDASTPRLELGTEAALVMNLVLVDRELAAVASPVVSEVRVRRVTGPAELRPDNGSSRDGWSHWVYMISRPGALLASGERFRFVPDTAQALFLEYGTPKYTTYFAQCALCHRRTNSGGQDPDGIRALGRYGHPSVETDAHARARLAEAQFAEILAQLRVRLGLVETK